MLTRLLLCTSVNIYAYPLISPIVKETCEEFGEFGGCRSQNVAPLLLSPPRTGLKYTNYKSFPEAWMKMMMYLKKLGCEGKEWSEHGN